MAHMKPFQKTVLRLTLSLLFMSCSSSGSTPPGSLAETLPSSSVSSVDSSPESPTPSQSEKRPDPPALAQKGAFVLYTEETTTLIPTDGDVSVKRSPGLWVLDEASPDHVVKHIRVLRADDIDSTGRPRCKRPNAKGRCLLSVGDPTFRERVVRAGSSKMAPVSDPCRCYTTEPNCPNTKKQKSTEEDDDWADSQACTCRERYELESAAFETFSIVGGVLFEVGSSSNLACSGLNLYDADSRKRLLVSQSPQLGSLGDFKLLGCGTSEDSMSAPRCILPPKNRVGTLEQQRKALDCLVCNNLVPEAPEVYTLRRGVLYRIEENTSGVWQFRWVAQIPVGPERCPSSADPCGDPSAFSSLSELDEGSEFWVSTDGSVALVFDGTRFQLLRPNSDRAHRQGELNLENNLLGVRFHNDVTILLNAMDQ